MILFRGKNSRSFINVGEQICNLRNEGNKKKKKRMNKKVKNSLSLVERENEKMEIEELHG